MVEMAFLRRAILSFGLMSVGFLPAHADENPFWRYFGGKPQFVGGKTCPLKNGEERKEGRRRGYDVCYLPRLKSCLWVAYALTPSDASNQVGRVGSFKKDVDALNLCVPSPGDYIGTGFDRGQAITGHAV